MEWMSEFHKKGDVPIYLVSLSTDAIAILDAAAKNNPELQLRFSANKRGGNLRWLSGVAPARVRSVVEAEADGIRASRDWEAGVAPVSGAAARCGSCDSRPTPYASDLMEVAGPTRRFWLPCNGTRVRWIMLLMILNPHGVLSRDSIDLPMNSAVVGGGNPLP